ncbi:SusC/RagA family TonB-linked outer membrane protein [Hymenobacter chitinivorans]|uniref:TonB-linked SusC/RagA family outer membrane protein n=1 Tax=Hymenobacter chitinivorans DSM 11115 TaxID=1121954 RepID=A0A2M9BL81_9BACT|nr:TonB-dependent receptor [Hymenobacter chitinivorans]PJJ58708.1 TonB-linked SusC/RagA family outer membrane protein [Hymenobacter chitinivorans DSM 11115]
MYQPIRKTAFCLSWPLFVASGLPLAGAVLMPSQAWAQATQTISGKITSSDNGETLPGVTVLQKGTTNGVSSNSDGSFTLQAPLGSTLVFSAVGYVSKEITVTDPTVNVTLGADVKALNEVVVVGYGTQRAEAVTGSVASVSGETLREVPSANISQALQGRLPGVEFSQSSSQPGATTQIRIRGTRSLGASNDPLVVLDGIPFPGSIGDINPNDIQSVDILKDASATAIYGSRGANGVVLITTKTGKKGQKPQITYDSFVGAKTLFAKYPMMNGPEFVALRKAAGLYKNALDEADDVDTDWQDLLYKTGIQSNHNLGVSGGTDNGRYNFNAGYYKEEGVIPTQQYTRYSVRGTLDQGVGKYIRLGFTTNNTYNLSEGSNVGIYGILNSSPIANPYNPDGSLKRTIRMPLDEQWVYTRGIVEDLSDRWLSETRSIATYNTIFAEVKMPGVEGLKYRVNLGANYRQSQGGSYTGQGINAVNPTTVSTASVSNQVTRDWTIENILSYDRTFAEKHNVNVIALYSASDNVFNQTRIAARDIPSDAFQYYNLGFAAGEITVNPNEQPYRKFGLLSYMGRVMYSYDDRYLLSATVRADGSSRLSPGNKWKTYPAVSVGWNVAKESFMQDISAINLLKLRAGYGITSNQSINPYATLGLLATRPYNFGPTNYQTGLFVSQLPNADLGWEFSKTWNYGLDFAVLKNRISGTVEYYLTNTEDVLLPLPLPSTSGVDSYTANIGSTQNKGVELSLNGVILENLNGWTWEAGFNLYANRNKITSLAGAQDRDENNWWFVGKPINVIYDYEKIGLWQQDDPYRSILEPGGNAGMIKVKYTGGYNADGTPSRAIGPQDRQILDVNPNFQGGFNTRVSYKGFDLSAVGAYQNGGLLNSTLYGSSGYLNLMNGRRGNVKVDYWTPENTGAKYPKPGGLASGDNPKYGSTLGYFDASYLKIRTISLGYNFDNNAWLKSAGVSRLRVYATAQNPFVIFSPYKKESGMDPETNSYADQNVAVTTGVPNRLLTIGTNSPATRTYLVGLNFTF